MGLGKKMSFSWKLLKWIYSVLEKSSSIAAAIKSKIYNIWTINIKVVFYVIYKLAVIRTYDILIFAV